VADQEETTMGCFVKSRSGKYCCFLTLHSEAFVDIKEMRKRLDYASRHISLLEAIIPLTFEITGT